MNNGLINQNVKLFFARDEYENIILINEINEHNKMNKFLCPICLGEVRPRCLDNIEKSMHFYHKNAKDCSGESIMHYWYKNEFIKDGDEITLIVEDEIINYKCKAITTEKEYETKFGTYKPDATVETDKGIILIEYKYSNKKKIDDYIDMWEELNYPVIEVDVKLLLESKRTSYKFKPLYFNGIIYSKTKTKRMQVIDKYISDNNIKDRIRIKYLNGILRDISRYNIGEISIEELSMIIDELNEYDLKAIPSILKNLSCNSVLNDYIIYKKSIIIDMIKEECENKKININYLIKYINFKYTRKYSEYNTSKIINSVVFNIPSYRYDKITYTTYEIGNNIIGNIDKEEINKNINKLIKSIYSYYKSRILDNILLKRKNIIDGYFFEYFKEFNIADTFMNVYKYKNDYIYKYSYIYKDFSKCKKRKEMYINYVKNEINKINKKESEKYKKNKNDIILTNAYVNLFEKACKILKKEYNITIEAFKNNETSIYLHCLEFDRSILYFNIQDRLIIENCIGRKEIIINHLKKLILNSICCEEDELCHNEIELFQDENKYCIYECFKKDNVLCFKWKIKVEKNYFDDEYYDTNSEVLLDLHNNTIIFKTCKKTFKYIAKDNIECFVFIGIYERKIKEYFNDFVKMYKGVM